MPPPFFSAANFEWPVSVFRTYFYKGRDMLTAKYLPCKEPMSYRPNKWKAAKKSENSYNLFITVIAIFEEKIENNLVSEDE